MNAACLGTIFTFAQAVPGMICKNKHLADLRRHIDELGNRAGDLRQRMDDGAERMNDCLSGVKG
jgi:hypothetical protein